MRYLAGRRNRIVYDAAWLSSNSLSVRASLLVPGVSSLNQRLVYSNNLFGYVWPKAFWFKKFRPYLPFVSASQDECQDRVPIVQLSFVCFIAYLICYDAIKQVSKKSCSALLLSNLVFHSPQRNWWWISLEISSSAPIPGIRWGARRTLSPAF